jgi:hypothetical protein
MKLPLLILIPGLVATCLAEANPDPRKHKETSSSCVYNCNTVAASPSMYVFSLWKLTISTNIYTGTVQLLRQDQLLAMSIVWIRSTMLNVRKVADISKLKKLLTEIGVGLVQRKSSRVLEKSRLQI